ncbi:kinase domain protein (macronuclear) [Tetrahymena thermophila SB210]|uniref:Kinase domain protein n=1 Tax=Tetrahymena thermophila (strain SB210) TaxID=312017 RepID=I7LWD7_TETTS|nr:kinase domain protein [Tetrahymena thermophila SB210]EAS01438.3 kinase domain protein [Tetrahymena thermophila SB210]|eukprot:XP_001021684.3 kinase domain protein [Tetrahymena thermophila SB210]
MWQLIHQIKQTLKKQKKNKKSKKYLKLQLNRFIIYLIMEKKDKDIVRGCQKFKEKFKYYSNSDKEAIIFLKLRNEGCPRKPALRFSSKTVCKSDSTRTIFGPRNHRILQVQQLPSYSLQNGWFQGNLYYNMDNEFKLSYKDILQEDIQDDNLKVLFNKNEEQAKEQFKKMLQITKQYFDEISQICTINRGNSKEEYLKSIQNFIQNTRKQLKTQTYFEYKNIKFYYLSSMLQSILDNEKKSSEEIESIIQKYNVFNDVLRQPDIKSLDIKQEDNKNKEQSQQLMSPSSKSGKNLFGLRKQNNQSSKEKLLNTSLSDNSMMMTLKSSPKVGLLQGSSDDINLPDLTLQNSSHQQTSIGPFDYMSSDSINSQERIQSQEDKSVYGDGDMSPKSSTYTDSSFKKSNISFINSAAQQLKLLQQMDQTNQDLFSNTPLTKLERVQFIEGSAESKRLLEQQFNDAQYFYQYQQQNNKSFDNKNQNNQNKKKDVKSKAKIYTNENVSSKNKQIRKFQSLLKVDADLEKEFLKLAQCEQYQIKPEDIQKQNNFQNQKQLEIQQQPPSPNTQKMSLFQKDFVESSKNIERSSRNKEEKIMFSPTKSSQHINSSQQKIDVLNKTDSFNLQKLVEKKKQMLAAFRKRNYKNLSNQFPLNQEAIKAPSNIYFQILQSKPDKFSHQRNQTYSNDTNSLLQTAKVENNFPVQNKFPQKYIQENENYFTMKNKYQAKKHQKSQQTQVSVTSTKNNFNKSTNDETQKDCVKDQRVKTQSSYFLYKKQEQQSSYITNSQRLSLSIKSNMNKTQNIFENLERARKPKIDNFFNQKK